MNTSKVIILFCTILLSNTFALAQTLDPKKSIVPKYFSNFWNADDIIDDNNCYNYATNRQTNSFAQPGETAHAYLDDVTCDEVYIAATKDKGVVPTSFFPFVNKQDDMLIALVVDEGSDFHWYRRGDDNLWTHKPGGTEVTNLDESGKKITNPEKADRGVYSEFCGYFKISNIVSDKHEQNGGQVMIGAMTKIPVTPISKIEILKYSGRKNPTAPLAQFENEFTELSRKLKISHDGQVTFANEKLNFETESPISKLGYQGLLIHDTEGLIFPKNVTVTLFKGHLITEFLFFGIKLKKSYLIPEISALEETLLNRMN